MIREVRPYSPTLITVAVGNMLEEIWGCLHGLAVACWTTDHYYPCSYPGMGISEGFFIFDFTSLPLEVAQPIQPTMCTKVAVKHQSSSSSSSPAKFCLQKELNIQIYCKINKSVYCLTFSRVVMLLVYSSEIEK